MACSKLEARGHLLHKTGGAGIIKLHECNKKGVLLMPTVSLNPFSRRIFIFMPLDILFKLGFSKKAVKHLRNILIIYYRLENFNLWTNKTTSTLCAFNPTESASSFVSPQVESKLWTQLLELKFVTFSKVKNCQTPFY